jgi:hypothetical protein
MIAEPVQVACLVPLGVLDDPPVIEATLRSHVFRAADRGEIELTSSWRLVDVRTEIKQSRFSSERAAWAFGTVLGAEPGGWRYLRPSPARLRSGAWNLQPAAQV